MRDRIIAAIESVFAQREAFVASMMKSAADLDRQIKAHLPDGMGILLTQTVTATIGRADIPELADAVVAAIVHHDAPAADQALELAADREAYLYWLCRLAAVTTERAPDYIDAYDAYEQVGRRVLELLEQAGCDRDAVLSAGEPLRRSKP